MVVNAAGRMDLAPLADYDLATFDELIRVNVRGTFVIGQQAVRRLRDGGALVTFSSSVVGLAFPNYSAYAASKGAVEAMTLVLARELRGRDITVNTVAPGPTATSLFLDNNSDEAIERLSKQPPLERLGQPEDIAGVVAFLAGPDGHWVNGQAAARQRWGDLAPHRVAERCEKTCRTALHLALAAPATASAQTFEPLRPKAVAKISMAKTGLDAPGLRAARPARRRATGASASRPWWRAPSATCRARPARPR